MISARTAFQIFRSETDGSVSDFSALPQEVALPYKIRAAEETMLASLQYVEEHSDEASVFAVSTVHSVCLYLSVVSSFLPLMARSNSATKIVVNYTALARTVSLFASGNAALVKRVMELVAAESAASPISFSDVNELEAALSTVEKDLKAKAKETGERAESFRKVAPEKPSADTTCPAGTADTPRASQKSQRRSPSKSAATQEGSDVRLTPTAQGSGTVAAVGEAASGHDGPRKVAKTEADGSVPSTTASRRRPASKPTHLVWGRLRALSNAEKKAVGMLNQMIHLLGHIFANKYNDLVPVFDHLLEQVKQLQIIMEAERAAYSAKEDRKPPEPFHEVSLHDLKSSITQSSQTFRDDELCRLWLDEDLVHPVAHACLVVLNQIEGYETAPFVPPTEDELGKKRQARVAFKEKREQAQRKVIERAKAREDLATKKEEEKRQLRVQLGNTVDEETLVEDTELTDTAPLGYVAYPPQLPLGGAEAYEQALFIWCMLSSVPGALSLSQMPFSLFLRSLEEEDQDANGLMEEITRCLLDVSIEHVRVSSPNTPRITTRGKNWFDALVEFVGVASGNKKQRRQQRRAPTPSEEDDDDEDEDDDDDDDDDTDDDASTSSSSSSTTPSGESGTPTAAAEEVAVNEEAAESTADDTAKPVEPVAPVEPAPEEEEITGFEKDLKETMENVASLRSLATWGNVDLPDRLNMLQFCVQEAIASDNVRAAADAALKLSEEQSSALDKRFKEIRDEAAKELKGLLRNIGASTTRKASAAAADHDAVDKDASEDAGGDDYETKKRAILREVERKREEVMKEVYAAQDGRDLDTLITPLGMDRYKRLYWRFPYERVVHVQTTPSTASQVPSVPKPAELQRVDMGYLFQNAERDEEDALLELGHRRGRGAVGTVHEARPEACEDNAAPSQSTWGIIAPEYLSTFAQTLDARGEREGHLRHVLEGLAPYLLSLEDPREARVTRARAHTFGYLNKLKMLL